MATAFTYLPDATALGGIEAMGGDQGGVTSKITPAQLATYIGGLATFASRGLTLANNATDANNDIDFAAGACPDDGYAAIMVLSALTKRLDATWAVGTNQGGLDTGAKANSTWYYCYVIRRPDTGVIDALFSLSASSPTMPTNYTQKMLVGAIRTNGSGNILAFSQIGNEVKWAAAIADVNNGTMPSTGTAVTTSTPPIAGVQALMTIYVSSPARRFGIRASASGDALFDIENIITSSPVYIPTTNGQVWWNATGGTQANSSLVCYGWKFPSRPVFAGG